MRHSVNEIIISASAICEYDIPQELDDLGNVISGFAYFASWNSTFPTLEMAGVGPLEIPLEEGHRAKDWTIQLRWPVSMNNVDCFSDKIVEKDCGGTG